jgi:integrase
MANKAVTIYRKIKLPDWSDFRYCRAIIGANHKVHPEKVEYQGTMISVAEGDFFLGYRNGKQRWERVGPDPKAAWLAAERKRAELAALATGLLEHSVTVGARGITVSLEDARDVYLNDLRRTRSGGTYDLFKQTLDEFVAWMAGRYPSVQSVSDIRREHLLSYYDVLVKKGLSLRHAAEAIVPASPSTGGKKCDRVNQWIRKTLNLRPGQGPIKRSDLPRECFQEEEVEVFTEAELQRFFAACADEEHLIFSLFLHTGIRNKEMQFLSWDDVDFEGGFITVRPKPELGFTVKNGEARTVPITDDDLLARLKAHQASSKFQFVFATSTGGRVRDFLDQAKKIGERAGMRREDVWVHKFRASCATGLALDGLGFTGVQQLLGHKDAKVTKRYLAKAADVRLREQIKAVREQARQRKALSAKVVSMAG